MKFACGLISIIIPVYNRENTLERCIDSLLEQTYQNIEILCIDDGSTDSSLDLIKKYAKRDNRIKVFSQNNKGPAAARNVGLANATGEYLMFCDSDDEYLHRMCEEMLNAIKANNVDLVMCNAEMVLGDVLTNDEISERRLQQQSGYCNSIVANNIISLNANKRVYLNVLLWNKIFKREIIVTNQIYFPEGCVHEDDFFIFLYNLFIERYYALNKRLYRYYINHNSIIGLYESGKPKDKYDLFKICCRAFDFLKKINKLSQYKTELEKFIIYKLSRIRVEFFTNEELINLCVEINQTFKELNLLCVLYKSKIIINNIKNFNRMLLIKLPLTIIKTLVLPTKKGEAN